MLETVSEDCETENNLENDTEHVFHCIFCNYSTHKKFNYDKHLSTSKHKFNSNENITKDYTCESCNKHFNNYNSLWKHNARVHSNNEDKIGKLTDLIVHVVEQNTILSQQICQLATKPITNTNNTNANNTNINTNATINTNTNNNNNNRFNLNLYLNETCKNAMNIDEFVDSIQVDMTDLEETSRLGFVDGVSRIIINNLNKINVRSNRPIHCSDCKRVTLYIKEEDKWVKNEESDDKMKLLIQTIVGKNIKQIFEWQKIHPEYSDPKSRSSDLYQKMLCEVMSGATDEECKDNITKIIKNIARETMIMKKNDFHPLDT